MMRTANPALSAKTFQGIQSHTGAVMTLGGTVNKTFILTVLLMIVASWSWNKGLQNPQAIAGITMIGVFGGLIMAIATIFKKTWAPITAPLYAALEGLALGGISLIFEMKYPGIAFQAVLCTIGTLLALLMAYRSGLIKATENFKLGVVAATGGIALIYFISMIMGFFGMQMPLLHSSSPLGIGISVVIIIVAALNLVLDFDFIEQGAKQRAPKYMEWYAAFGLMVTLIWLYLEFLRLLAKLRSRH